VSAAPRPSHAARLSSSPRLRALLTALLKAGDRGLTTREIFDRTGSMAVHSDCHELRQNGYRISCEMVADVRNPGGQGGSRRYRYRIEGNITENVESPVLSTGLGRFS
jgi:hypothetical protein